MAKKIFPAAALCAALQLLAAVVGCATLNLLPVTSAHASNGQCRWEGGAGKAGGFGYCEAEDCLGDGGLAQCSAGQPASAGWPDSQVGPDKWAFHLCDEGAPSMSIVARWCTSAGGQWVINGSNPTCENLPAGVLGGGGTILNSEDLAVATSDTFMGVGTGGTCPVTVASQTEWGTQTDSFNCWSGSTSKFLNVPIDQYRVRNYNAGGACGNQAIRIIFRRNRSAVCPDGYKSRTGVRGQECYKPEESSCCATWGNPVSAISGAKIQQEVDYQSLAQGGLRFVRNYRSMGYYRPTVLNTGTLPVNIEQRDYWRHNYEKRLTIVSLNTQVMAILELADGSIAAFDATGKEMKNDGGAAARLQVVGGIGWDLTLANSDVERYNLSGQLISITTRAGLVTTLTYTSGKLTAVTDPFGHMLTLAYTAQGRLDTLTLPSGGVIHYGYDSYGRPTTVTYPGNVTKTYLYEDVVHRWALTGITDESTQRFSTYTYDAQGRVVTSEHAGGAEHYQFAYNTGSTTITDPSGASVQAAPVLSAGIQRRGTYSTPCQTCGIVMSASYDANGNRSSSVDFNNNETRYTFDLTRNLETSRTEAYGTPRARTITTQWHATFRLPTQIDEPGRTTNFSYDTWGNLLTRTVTDTATSQTRTWAFTYNNRGQVLTADGPRTDVNDITTYTYQDCSYGAECGQLATVTDPVGNVTSYLTYNLEGQPLSMTDPNGVAITLTYDARQHLTSREVGGQVTSFSYYDTGLLKRVTLPDGSYVENTYDAAQRLIGVEDGEGNNISYTLNAAGDRISENVYDTSQTLTRTRSFSFNTLGRMTLETDAGNNTLARTYDLNGNVTDVVDQENRPTVLGYDELNRQTSVMDAMGGLAQNAYTARDELQAVTDSRSLTTSYQYNGFGDLKQISSPDTGITQYARDAAGNIHQATDARNKAATYSYDAAGRVTQIAYGDQTMAFTYDQGANGKGRMTSLTDGSGASSWSYTPQGRVASKQQVAGGITLTLAYGYNSAGQLTQITTASGQVVDYTYSNGRPASITVNGNPLLSGVLYTPFGPTRGWNWANGTLAVREYDLDGRATTIDSAGLSSYAFNPDGTIQSWADDSATSVTAVTGLTEFAVDSASNQLASSSGAEVRSFSYDAAGNVTGDGTSTFVYNDAGRMSSATKAGITATYSLNALGQRVKKTKSGASTYFVYDETGHLLGEYTNSGSLIQEIVWLDDVPVATLRPGSGGGVNVYYIHTDHLNTPRRITRPSDNVVVWRWDSDPFGAASANEDPDGDATPFAFNLRFPGQYFDSESGLHYNYYRDYDATTGRYVQSDPIGLRGGINTYLYAGADPIANVDPSGLVHWRGLYAMFGGGPGWRRWSAVGFNARFYLVSDCVNGSRGKAYVEAKGMGLSAAFGAPLFLASSPVDFEDGLSYVDPMVFEGDFHMFTIGTFFYSWVANIRMGGASGTAKGLSLSTSLLEATYLAGKAKVLRKRVECCTQ